MMKNKGFKDQSNIRKGPWSAEEDEVLIDFVNKNGPRDWSSIQSKGLLPRTGKSCRLRWVNKLRPNLKVGCKFSAEEERIVVELQARLGNKWATIASHLTGRTDNDVKNFWSSRKKRLARTLNSSLQPKCLCLDQNKQKSAAPPPQLPSKLEVSDSCTSMILVGAHPSSNYDLLGSSSRPLDIEPISSLLAPDTVSSSPLIISSNPSAESTLSESSWFPQQPNPAPVGESSWSTLSYPLPLLHDHHMNDFEPVFTEPTSFCQSFPYTNTCDFEMPIFGGSIAEGSCSKSIVPVQRDAVQRDSVQNLPNHPDGFFDDFPIDVFDSLDPLPISLDYFH